MNVARWLAEAAQEWPSRPALATGYDVESNYREFAGTASALAGHLHDSYGVGPGDRVVIYLENSTRYLECLFAIWWAGAVAVPVNHKLHGAEMATIVDDVEPRLLFATSADRALLSAAGVEVVCAEVHPEGWSLPMDGAVAPVERAPDDCAWIFYSSGTTGQPKGVMLSNTNLVAMSLCYLADVDEVLEGETALYAAPISHGAGLYSLIHVRRGSQHLVPSSGGFDADEVLDLAEAWGTVSMFAAPTMVRRLVASARRRPDPGHGLKTVVYGGGPMYLADIEEAMEVLGDRFVQIYGQAESPMTVTALSRDNHRRARAERDHRVLSSVGRPHSAVAVRIGSSDGNELGPGEVGEIEVRGSTVMLGYWGDPEATSRTLRDGWLRTGDLGHLDERGFLTLAGRSKEVIISGGSNIYPREVEDALIAHPDVLEAAVIGVPDQEWGEVVVAFVVATPGSALTDSTLDEHCLQLIARFKRPRIYRVVDELPKNNNGKVVKSQLGLDRHTLGAGPGAPLT